MRKNLEKRLEYYITKFKKRGLDKRIKEIHICNFKSQFKHEEVLTSFNKIKTSDMAEYFIENGILCFKQQIKKED